MIFGICLLIAIYLLYVLFIRGALFKLILGSFGWFGMYWWLSKMPECTTSPFVDNTMTWAAIIPTVLVLLVLLCTKEE